MTCCGKKTEVRQDAKRKPATPGISPEDNPELGCYLYLYDTNLWLEWASSTPEQPIILFAHPTKRIPKGKFTCRDLGDSTDEDSFLNGIIEFVQEAGPYIPEIRMMQDANENVEFPFVLMVHQLGNSIIGDRIVRLNPGKVPICIEGSDCAAVVLKSADIDAKQLPAQEFIEKCQNAGGKVLRLDPSGRIPPLRLSK